MLQRIQTIFMALVVVTCTAMFFLPLISFISDLYYLKLYLYEFRNLTPDSDVQFGFTTVLPMILINGGILLLTTYAIFQYKKRIQQVKMVRLSLLLTTLMIVGVFVLYPNIVVISTDASYEFLAGAYIPILNLLLLFLANHYILKDEKLVRSIDRLR